MFFFGDFMSNEILLRGDCHIFPHAASMDRAKDCLEAYEWTYKEAVKNNIKHVVDLGDVFHERSHVDSYTHSSVYEISKKYWNDFGIKTIFILGNHDMYFREGGQYSSIVSFESLGEVVSEPKTIDILGRKIDCLPYVENAVGRTLVDNFPLGQRSDILLFHCSIENALCYTKLAIQKRYQILDLLHQIVFNRAVKLGNLLGRVGVGQSVLRSG
jgi:hypothetical protein